MKDSVGPVALGTGATMQITPAFIIQCIGAIVTIFGAYYTYKQVTQSKRANDLKEESIVESRRANDLEERRLNWEISKNANSKHIQTSSKKEKGTSQEKSTNEKEVIHLADYN